MPVVLEGAVPPPHLHLTPRSWSYSPHKYSVPPTSSPIPMSPDSLPSYMPHHHLHHENSLPSQDLPGLPTSGWYGASIPAPDCQHETGYGPVSYDQPYVTPHTSSVTFSPPTQFSKANDAPLPLAKTEANFSPASEYSRVSDGGQPDYVRQAEDSYEHARLTTELPAHLQESNAPARPHSSPSTFTPNHPSSGPVDYHWTMNPLGISTPNMHEHYYPTTQYAHVRTRSPRLSEPAMELPLDLAAPQPRRMYTPIAPHPIGPQRMTSVPKRARDDDEGSDQGKRRKRSDSNTTMSMELGEEDKLLIQLKDEESMPWKDIAARFQSDLGKTYQIPALQMRLKRLRERMRVWTETDLRALRMAHEYWVQSKFDIISQKMLEFGAAEKWTARQCARKWAEIDPGPTPYTTYDHHSTPSYAPYTMSPVEAPPFMPYLHIP
ncbi:hypothetical protein BDV95DRAFT_674876 [Massariosphaeria phaeospora]|uniref:Myb-like domain-containing protein n=1 Tax=Massariosphaeria phaeospora TaxID=100035 RepID=A0A7C8MAX0_9PLEO|nr:hypothetical protein BDV95DRAFT_674876 [Massariosphaeria phaeospora]